MAYKTADPLIYGLLKDNARTNRHNPTEAESAFWQCVRCNALGDKCIRQHAIGDYIVDFLFRKSMLVVEIDGGYHFTDEQQHDDAVRTEWLEKMGYRVIRFTNEQILFDTENSINEIKQNLKI